VCFVKHTHQLICSNRNNQESEQIRVGDNLLVDHLVEERHEPLLKLAVVFIGHQQVSDAVEALVPGAERHLCTTPQLHKKAMQGAIAGADHPARNTASWRDVDGSAHLQTQRLAVQLEAAGDSRVQRVAGPEVCRGKALDNVLLDPAGRGDNGVDHLVLAQIANGLAHAARRHVAGVPQEDRGLDLFPHLRVLELLVLVLCHRLVRQAPRAHLVDFLHRHAEVARLEAACDEAVEQRVVVHTPVEIVSLDLDAPRGHLHRLDEDGIGGRGGDRGHRAGAVQGDRGAQRGGGGEDADGGGYSGSNGDQDSAPPHGGARPDTHRLFPGAMRQRREVVKRLVI